MAPPLSQSKHWTVALYRLHNVLYILLDKTTTEGWKESMKTTEIKNTDVKKYNKDNDYNY